MKMEPLEKIFESHFGRKPAVLSRAPGRLEILGNHTDYNEGYVLSAAVTQATSFAMAPKEGSVCTLVDCALSGEFKIDLDNMDAPRKGDWTNYLKGALVELRRRGVRSAGMSSSAALEMAFCFALKTIYGIDLPKADWARVGQAVENKYMGLQSGLLDQFSSIFGRKDALILCDFRSVEVLKNVPMPPGYSIVVANTMVKHNLVESDYNKRRESCERARDVIRQVCPQVKMLRDVDRKMLESCRDKMDAVDYRRALHVVGEDERVMRGVAFLEKGDIRSFGELLFESHESSRVNFENSCPELDALVEIARSIPDCLGARLSGGGFGGITIHLVRHDAAEGYCNRLKTAYKAMTGKETQTILCDIGDGASAQALLSFPYRK